MAQKKIITLQNAEIALRNFAGKEGQYNPAGKRNFIVFLEQETSDILVREGWNVKWTNPRDDEQQPRPFLRVEVSYKNIPPEVYKITSKGAKIALGEDDIQILDWAEIENIDLSISGYEWEMNGKTGIKAYLRKMYVKTYEDELDQLYSELHDLRDG